MALETSKLFKCQSLYEQKSNEGIEVALCIAKVNSTCLARLVWCSLEAHIHTAIAKY